MTLNKKIREICWCMLFISPLMMACKNDVLQNFAVGDFQSMDTILFMYEGPGLETGAPSPTNITLEVTENNIESNDAVQNFSGLSVKFTVDTGILAFTGINFKLPEINAPIQMLNLSNMDQDLPIPYLKVTCRTPSASFREGPVRNINLSHTSKYFQYRAPCNFYDEVFEKNISIFDLAIQIRIDQNNQLFYEIFAVKHRLSANPHTIIAHSSEQEWEIE